MRVIKPGRTLVAMLVLSALLLNGCGAQGANGDSSGEKALSVYCSFYPMYDFALKIGGDKVKAVNMVPSETEPHDWEPSAADIAGLEGADVFVYNGLGMEHWAQEVLASLQNAWLIAAETSENVDIEGDDPHVWLDPQNAKIQMQNIRDALCAADPDNKSYYEANYAKYADELDELDAEFTRTLSALPGKDIIVAHQAFGYLCAAYGLNQVAIEGISADSEPEPARMAEIIDFARAHEVSVIFFEEMVSPKVAQTIADAIGARCETLSPIEGLSDEESAAGGDYFSVMRKNLSALAEALK